MVTRGISPQSPSNEERCGIAPRFIVSWYIDVLRNSLALKVDKRNYKEKMEVINILNDEILDLVHKLPTYKNRLLYTTSHMFVIVYSFLKL